MGSNSFITLVSTVFTTTFSKPLRRQCFKWTMIFVSISSCVCPIWRSSLLTLEELHIIHCLQESMQQHHQNYALTAYLPEMSSRQLYFYNRKLHVCLTSKDSQNNYHKLYQYVNIQRKGSGQTLQLHLQICWRFWQW